MKKRIMITGATGMLGSALVKELGYSATLYTRRIDLLDAAATYAYVQSCRPTHVYHLAARVGGLGVNMSNNAGFMYENTQMCLNLFKAVSELDEVPKVLSALSSCIYPDGISFPLLESNLHSGRPHASNYGYAYAKRMIDVYGHALNEKIGTNKFITVTPNNMYGENDNFSLTEGHVVPTVIHKLFLANQRGDESVTFWGDGTPLRQFTYASDIARDMIFCMENYEDNETINVGMPTEFTINDLVTVTKELIGYRGEIIWDIARPNGQHRKPSSIGKYTSLYQSFKGTTPNYHTLSEGLTKTINWFKTNYPNVRGT